LATSGGYSIYSSSKVVHILFEKVVFNSIFSVTGLTLSAPTLKYMWGISTTDIDTTKTKCSVGFYKSGATYLVYNNFVLTFSIPTTPDGQNLRVEFAMPTSNF